MKFRRLIAASALVGLLSTFAVAIAQPAPSVDAASEPKGWNYSEKNNQDGSVTGTFREFQNFMGVDGKWKAVDLLPKQSEEGFDVTEAPYSFHAPLFADQDFIFTSTNRYSIKEKRMRDDPPVSKTIQFLNTAPVGGVLTDEGILYPSALPGIQADLLIHTDGRGVRNVVKWNDIPVECQDFAGDIRVPFVQTFNNGLLPRENNGNLLGTTDKRLNGFKAFVNDFRGIGTPQPRVWDSSGELAQNIDFQGKRVANQILAEKIVNCSFFQRAVLPVYTDDTSTFFPDPNTETTSVDGQAGYDGTGAESWATVRGAADGTTAQDSSASGVMCGAAQGDGFEIYRGLLLFDTSSLADTASISAATITLTVTAKTNDLNDGDDTINFFASTPASNTAITTADYDQVNSTAQATAIDIGDISIVVADVWTMNATGISNISKTGVSKFGCREGHDIANAEMGGGQTNRIIANFAETALTTTDPTLTVTFTVPSASPKGVIIIKNFIEDVLPDIGMNMNIWCIPKVFASSLNHVRF